MYASGDPEAQRSREKCRRDDSPSGGIGTRARQVFIRYVFRYFMGRNETPGDAATLQEADRVYVKSGGSFKALVVSLLTSESFLYRTVPVKSQVRKPDSPTKPKR